MNIDAKYNDDLKKRLNEYCCELNYMIKFLDRVKPAICSLDGNKQLRMSIISLVNQMEIAHKKLNICYVLLRQKRKILNFYFLSKQQFKWFFEIFFLN